MTNTKTDRRDFLKGALVGTSVAVTSTMSPTSVAASTQTNNSNTSSENQAYLFLNTSEQDFIETVINHMIPADDLSPKGTDIGIHYFIDRALAGSWGKGDRLYMSGPWKKGLPTQGYQLPLTPSDLYRVSIDQSNKYCVEKYGVNVKKLSSIQLEEFLLNLKDGKINFPEGPPSKVFFTILYENIMEGMFSDPIYGGNKNKVGWKLIGFPGAIATHALDVEKYFDKKYTAPMFGISDLS